MATFGEGVETVLGDYRIRIVQVEIDRHISVFHIPSRTFVFNDLVPAGFPPLPGARASDQDCMKYAVGQALIHAERNDDPAAVSSTLKWDRGNFPRPELTQTSTG